MVKQNNYNYEITRFTRTSIYKVLLLRCNTCRLDSIYFISNFTSCNRLIMPLPQSGIRTVTLYDPNDTTFDKLANGDITNIAGTTIVLDNCKRPNLENTIRKLNRELYSSYTVSFTIFNLDQSQVEAINYTLGWFVRLDFYNGDSYLINSPHRFTETTLVTNDSNHYPMAIEPDRQTSKPLKIV